MTKTMPIIEARKQLTRLPEELDQDPEAGAVAVTRRGKPVLAVLSWELYEAIVETLEIVGDDDLMDALRQGVRELEAGKGVPWERAREELSR